jgi:hypothetical protein
VQGIGFGTTELDGTVTPIAQVSGKESQRSSFDHGPGGGAWISSRHSGAACASIARLPA